MQRVFSISSGGQALPNKRKKTVGREIVIGPNAIRFVAVSICALLALAYLTQSTAGANRSMKIGGLEFRQEELARQKERLESESNRLQSLGKIEQDIEEGTLEPATSFEYPQK